MGRYDILLKKRRNKKTERQVVIWCSLIIRNTFKKLFPKKTPEKDILQKENERDNSDKKTIEGYLSEEDLPQKKFERDNPDKKIILEEHLQDRFCNDCKKETCVTYKGNQSWYTYLCINCGAEFTSYHFWL